MSDWTSMCDAIAADLTLAGQVPARPLEGATVHKYGPWDPEELTPDPTGTRHVGVWAAGEGVDGGQAEQVEGGIGFDILKQRYRVLVWEQAPQEGDRLVRDEAADAAFLQLHNDVRARFYLTTNLNLGDSEICRYEASRFPEKIGQVRWFELQLYVEQSLNFT